VAQPRAGFATSQTILVSWFAPEPALTVQTLRSIDDRPAADAAAQELLWVTFRVGQQTLGAHLGTRNGSDGDEIEVLPLTTEL